MIKNPQFKGLIPDGMTFEDKIEYIRRSSIGTPPGIAATLLGSSTTTARAAPSPPPQTLPMNFA